MLSAAELLDLQRTQESAMPDECVVKRDTRTPDGALGWTMAPEAVAVVACRIDSTNPGQTVVESSVAERLGGGPPYIISMPVGTDVGMADRIEANGRTFEVARLLQSSYRDAERAVVLEVL